MRSSAKRVLMETVGWLLVVAGIAALVLPGPGLLMLFAGLAVLSQQYEWAERWLDPIKYRALKAAAEGVETWPRIIFSTSLAIGLIGCGALWVWSPPAPAWWPVADAWWLPGGIAVAVTQVVSGIVAIALIVYSYRRFHGRPDAVAELARATHAADLAVRRAVD